MRQQRSILVQFKSLLLTTLVFVLLRLVLTAQALGAPSSTSCDLALPSTAQYAAMFQKDIDGTRDFVLQVRHLQPPTGWYVQIGYLALTPDGTPLAINPTLLATPGATMRFTLVNCLGEDEIAWITGYNALDAANAFSPTAGSFNAYPAEEMTPTGYINVHTHGMHGSPAAGTPTVNAGDEVLTTFVSPVSRPFSDNTVSNQQVYSIVVPRTQDPGLYWYHPHLHGEAQPQVFLGLTGAIRVLRKRPGDATGAATIAADLAAHTDASAHPSVFVVRDYPVAPFADPGSSASANAPTPSAQPGARATLAAEAHSTSAAQAHHRVREHREQYLERTTGGRAPTAVPSNGLSAPQTALHAATASSANPRCALVDQADASPLCLPDAVSADPSQPPPAPSLATLVTVNGRQTDVPSGGTPDAPDHLDFQPIAPGTTDRILRVLNASANTYVKLSLSTAPLTSVDLASAPTLAAPTVKLTQLRRDGAPVRSADRSVSYILLPPGGRAEFKAALTSNQPLALVSQYFNTGPAGDLVPPRTLVKLPKPSQAASTPELTAATAEEPTPERSERFPRLYTTPPHPTHRALAFFEQDRPCDPSKDCGTAFYLLDITAAVFGTNGSRTPIAEAHAFALPMGTLNGNPVPVRDLFDPPNGRFKSIVPSIQVNLQNQPEVDEEWDVYNFTGEAHAFHIHQLGFLVSTACSPAYLKAHGHSPDCRNVASAAGDENHEAGLVLDVVNLPPAISVPAADPLNSVVYPARVHLRVPFTQDIAGNFVMHCHLLEHEDNGMMMGVQVWPNMAPPAPAPSGGMAAGSGMSMP